MICQADDCQQLGIYRERFGAVLCARHYVLALLGWLKNKELLMAYADEAQGGSPNPLAHPRLQA